VLEAAELLVVVLEEAPFELLAAVPPMVGVSLADGYCCLQPHYSM